MSIIRDKKKIVSLTMERSSSMKLISDRLKNGEKPIGTFLNLGSQTAAECVATAGMDYFIVDLEHSPFGLAEAADCIRMAKLKGISPLVRIPEISRANILKHLDVGAEGIIIPGLKTREEAEKIVEYGKYTPLGSRGFCPTRVCEFGYGDAFANGILEYTRKTNEETMLIPQCETLECLADIENIVSVEGIGGIFIGPFDLSLAMGIPAQFDRPEFKEAITKVLTVCHEKNKPVFIFAPNKETARLRLEQGFDSVTVNGDLNVMTEAYMEIVKSIRA